MTGTVATRLESQTKRVQELTEENMTRRQWRKAQSEKYGFEMGKSTSEIGAVSSAQKAAKKLHSKSLGARSFPERKW